VTNVSDRNFPGYVPGEEAISGWDLGRFREGLTVRVTRLSNRTVEFDLVGVDASIANAFRRIMIGEVCPWHPDFASHRSLTIYPAGPNDMHRAGIRLSKHVHHAGRGVGAEARMRAAERASELVGVETR
jgi:hypothetical protein